MKEVFSNTVDNQKYSIMLCYWVNEVEFNLSPFNLIRLLKLRGFNNWRNDLVGEYGSKYYEDFFKTLDQYWNDENINPISLEDLNLFDTAEQKEIVIELINNKSK
jgi:hypothetical protein